MIELQNICKSYKVARRSAGLGAVSYTHLTLPTN